MDARVAYLRVRVRAAAKWESGVGGLLLHSVKHVIVTPSASLLSRSLSLPPDIRLVQPTVQLRSLMIFLATTENGRLCRTVLRTSTSLQHRPLRALLVRLLPLTTPNLDF